MRYLILALLVISSTLVSAQRSANFMKGLAFFDGNNYKNAEVYFKKEFKVNPDLPTRIYLSRCLFMNKKYQECLDVSAPLIREDADKIRYEMIVLRSVAFIRTDQIDSAIHHCDMGIEMEPEDPLNYTNKAAAYERGKMFVESKDWYNRAYQLDTTSAELLLNCVEACYPTRDFEEALAGLFKLRQMNPKLAIEMNFGYCYSEMERYREADSVYQIVNKMEDAYFLNNYGFNKFKLGQNKEGKELILKSLKIDSKNSYAYRNLALIALAEGDNKAACAYLLKAKKYKFAEKYGSEVDELLAKHCQ